MSTIGESLREGAQAVLDKAAELQSRIRQRAYEIWEREGRQHGRDQDHWQEAERGIGQEDTVPPETAAPKAPRGPKKLSTAGEAKASAPAVDAAAAIADADSPAPKRKRRPQNASVASEAVESQKPERKPRPRKPKSTAPEIDASKRPAPATTRRTNASKSRRRQPAAASPGKPET